MSSITGKSLADAVALLRALPRTRNAERAARVRFNQFRAANPQIACQLLIDSKPGSDDLDHDILITIPEAGTVSLSWRPHGGVPWTALYADHWAANFVLSVNGRSTSIQSALLYLSTRLRPAPDLMQDLVDRALLSAAIEEAPLEISDDEIDDAVDRFRIGQHLFGAAETQKWLDEMQLTQETLRELVAQNIQLRNFKNSKMTPRQVRSFFEAHHSHFNRVTVMRLDFETRRRAQQIAREWRRVGTCPVLDCKRAPRQAATGQFDTAFARDLPPELANATPGTVIGPISSDDRFWIGQVIARSRARFDEATRDRIRRLLFDSWLEGQRATAAVRWHWI